MGRANRYLFLLLIPLGYIISCSSAKVHYEYPPDWKSDSARNATITKYSEFLRGKKIFLDPGHGGEDRHNKGNFELVVEADINLKVGLYLREYLTQAGAEVIMSRDKDATVPLKLRSELANTSGADVFISIHHNAPGKKEDDYTNYTSTYYHALETDFEHEPSNRDIARYIQRDLAYVMDNPGGLGSFDGTYSDYNIYPKAGFSVLRLTTIPAVLVEGSFFTNKYEEQRLSLDEFNKIQAWGIFRGLAKYYKAGYPEITPLYDESISFIKDKAVLEYSLKDKAGINKKSISVYIDSVDNDFHFNPVTSTLTLDLTKLKPGEYSVRIICANISGNHSLPFFRKVRII
ncbi:MAG: N-acetylmuramoyl-L-alanine amidase [Ignavibacteriales bacterium]|nr:MAG: N-acetylmuramoyl-L-alanine amidase [Ignavibacteriales bacterium]